MAKMKSKAKGSRKTTILPPLPGSKSTPVKKNDANTTFVEAPPAAAQKENAMSSPKPNDKALKGEQKVSPRLTRSASKRAQTHETMDSLARLKNNNSSRDGEAQNPRSKSLESHNRHEEWEQPQPNKRAKHSSSSSATNNEDLEQTTPDKVHRIATGKLQGSKVSDSVQQMERVSSLEDANTRLANSLREKDGEVQKLKKALKMRRVEFEAQSNQIQTKHKEELDQKDKQILELQTRLGDANQAMEVMHSPKSREAMESKHSQEMKVLRAEIEEKEQLLKQTNETNDSLKLQLAHSRYKSGAQVKQTQKLKGRIEEVKGGELEESQQQLGDMAVKNEQGSAKLEQKEATVIDLTESSSDEEMSIDESNESDDNEFSDTEEAVDNTTGSESAEMQMARARTFQLVNCNGNTEEKQLISHADKTPEAGAVQRTALKISNSGSFKIAPASEITRKDIVNADSMVLWVSKCDENGLEYKIANPFAKDGDVKYQDPLPLNEGDNFLIPRHNHFVVENTSSESDAILFYTLL